MKLFIFDLWQGYVANDYVPIVAETIEEARDFLYEHYITSYRDEVHQTCEYILKYNDNDKYPREFKINYRTYTANSVKEYADKYFMIVMNQRAERLRTCNFVFVDLPLKNKGYIEEIFHCYQE